MQALRGWASVGHPAPPPPEVLCPLATEHPRPAGEPANADDVVEIRCAACEGLATHAHRRPVAELSAAGSCAKVGAEWG